MGKEEIKFLNWLEVMWFMDNEHYAERLEDDLYNQFEKNCEALSEQWEYQEAVEEFFDLEEGFVLYRCVFKNLVDNNLYATDIAYLSHEGWEEVDLEWFPVKYTERIIRDYSKVKDAEDSEK